MYTCTYSKYSGMCVCVYRNVGVYVRIEKRTYSDVHGLMIHCASFDARACMKGRRGSHVKEPQTLNPTGELFQSP